MTATLNANGVVFGDATAQNTANNLPANTTNVLSATAAASIGAVGSYAFLGNTNSGIYAPGATVAASGLYYSSVNSSYASSPRPSGTWRLMGAFGSGWCGGQALSLFLRIS